MLLKIRIGGEPLPAHGAAIWLLPSVDSHVGIEMTLCHKSPITNGTNVWFLHRTLIWFTSTGIISGNGAASIWLEAIVDPHVLGENIIFSESLPAKGAPIWPVNLHVVGKHFAFTEFFCTYSALIWRIPIVDSHVDLQI